MAESIAGSPKKLWKGRDVAPEECVSTYHALVRSWDWLTELHHPNILRYIGTAVVRNSHSGTKYPFSDQMGRAKPT